MLSVRALGVAVVLVSFASGIQGGAAFDAGSSPDSPISITGTEYIAWNQAAADVSQASRYQYAAFVDDVAFVLADVGCQDQGGAVILCADRLPPMSAGPHRIELAASDTGLESPRSSPVYVLMIGKGEAIAAAGSSASRVITTSDGARVSVETLVTGLDSPSSLAATPDGRVFVAQASGKVSIWQRGLLPTPAAILSDVQRVPGAGLIGMALHPEFGTNGSVYIAYVGRSRSGALVNRIVRFQELSNVLRQGIVIFEDTVPAVAPRAPRIRFGPDKKLYVAFPAADWSIVDSYASYAGKVLRLNDDGTTPRDNPRASPIISAGHAATGGFDWKQAGRLWMSERDRNGRDVLSRLSADFEDVVAASFASEVDASGTAFYSGGALSAFNGDLFIAGLAGQELRRVHFDPRDPTRIASSEGLLKRELGRLSDVVAGPDGALYVSTSNRGTASAAANDDRLLRLSPAKP